MFSYVMMTKNMQEQYINFKNQINFTANKDLLLTANLNLESKKLIEEDVFFKNATVYFPFMLHVISTAICFFTGRTACKVLMQRLGFSLPLVLSTPATLLLMIILSIKNINFFIYMTFFLVFSSFNETHLSDRSLNVYLKSIFIRTSFIIVFSMCVL